MPLLRDGTRDHSVEEMLLIRRAAIAFLLAVICFDVLIANLYHLQAEQHDFYQTRSNQNDIRILSIVPSRGLILGRNGIPLVQNITLYCLQVIPSKIPDIVALLQSPTPVVDLTPDDIASFRDDMHHNSRHKVVTLKSDLSDVEVARFVINESRFPGMTVESYQQRECPHGAELAYVVGYVSKINDNDLQRLARDGEEESHAADHNIGKQGTEGYYEKTLHGTIGYQEVEVDNHGRVVCLLKEAPPVAGKNFYLTLDLHLQQYTKSVLKGQCAAVVVVDPRDGGVLTMVFSPSYDPNPFVKGIGYQAYKPLLDNLDRPLINRVTQGLYPLVLTVKPYMALSVLSAGVITPNTTFFGAPTWTLPDTQRRYRDWLKTGHGTLNVAKAIEESADIFLYQVVFKMGIDRIHEWLGEFGYGQSTGIDLNEEYAGALPSREWKQRVYKKPWYQGDTILVGTGQGYWVATPIQMVKALTTPLSNGKVQDPHPLYSMKQGDHVERYQQPANLPQVDDLKSLYWGIMRNGMHGMANLSNGTSYELFHTALYQIAAKSGTSQVFSLKQNQTYNAKMIPVCLRDHILYTLFAPYQYSKVAMALILENGGGGGVVAGLTARAILDHIFAPQQAPPAAVDVPQRDSADTQ